MVKKVDVYEDDVDLCEEVYVYDRMARTIIEDSLEDEFKNPEQARPNSNSHTRLNYYLREWNYTNLQLKLECLLYEGV